MASIDEAGLSAEKVVESVMVTLHTVLPGAPSDERPRPPKSERSTDADRGDLRDGLGGEFGKGIRPVDRAARIGERWVGGNARRLAGAIPDRRVEDDGSRERVGKLGNGIGEGYAADSLVCRASAGGVDDDAGSGDGVEFRIGPDLVVHERVAAQQMAVEMAKWGDGGAGRIGTEVGKRALAFGMRVVAYDPFLSDARAKALGFEGASDPDAVYRAADFITVHLPVTPETRGMINAESIAKMKPGVRLVNCARGEIINEADLLAALESGRVAGAALDVFITEPLPADHKFRTLPNVVLTPHLGASTEEAQEKCGLEVAEIITGYLLTGEVRNSVNLPGVGSEERRVGKECRSRWSPYH